MSYPRFFVDSESIEGSTIVLKNEAAQHISRSLRMTAGEKIVVCDTQKKEYLCVLETFSSDSVTARIEDVTRNVSEPLYDAVVYQACPKSDKMDTIVQKAVELGACGIVAFMSDRCIARYDEKGFEKKCARWQKIAEEAAKQSGRGCVPYVRWLPNLKSVISEITQDGIGFMCYEDEDGLSLKGLLSEADDCKRFGFIIGPEGGFSEKEADECRMNGIKTVGLGKRILRTETASGYVLACLSYEKELSQK
ncbi:MAG: 16S rRNA (uracil(1498)-N(3))-methyltransferase [Ruminococcaceae bacterium]|nr:16S rRNA (uracil(1498)-N(3))-methyltransferase [Oscillospiraceae bacterium]